MIQLEVQSGAHKGLRLSFDVPALTIGRGPQNQVALQDYHLSGEHGQIFREDDRYIYRDLRSTNGSRLLRRDGQEVTIDGAVRWEVPLRDGDRLVLGSPAEPVVVALTLPPESEADAAEQAQARVLARRSLSDVDEVAGKVERDPTLALALLSVSKRMGRRGLELSSVFEGIAEAVFELLPLATHLAIDLADNNDGRMSTVFGAARDGSRARADLPGARSAPGGPGTLATAGPGGASPPPSPSVPSSPAGPSAPSAPAGPSVPSASAVPIIRASRAVVRRVVRERAAILVANAPEELGGTDSIMGARIQSTIGVPLWEGDALRGVIQCDNRASAAMFRERDLEVMLVLAGQATLAIENARLLQRLRLAEEQLRGENRYLKSREEKRRFADIIGDSAAMRELFRQVEKVTDTRATVCIEGETGTGKELIASVIHYQGRRRDKLFVAQNCAAVPDNLLESELFGHKKGAFTGADQEKKGLFEVADGGTLFLDEIGEMSLNLQAKLLRVLQEGEVRPIGATQARQVDVRIICATNRSLEKEVAGGRFRQDLYYRIKVFPLRLPALRERREDIPRLAHHFLTKYSSELKKVVAGFTPETLDQMSSYGWPGNVREVENEVQRMMIQAEPMAFLTPDLLSPQIRQVEGLLDRIAPKKGTLKDMLEEVERWLLAQALRDHGGNKTKTAETLGITREGLHKKLAKFGM